MWGRQRGLGAFFVPQVEFYENWVDQTLFWVLVVFSTCSCRVSGLSPLDAPGNLSDRARQAELSSIFIRDFLQESLLFGGGLFLHWAPASLVNFSPILFESVWTVYAACGFGASAQVSRRVKSGHPGLARPSMFDTRNFISCFL